MAFVVGPVGGGSLPEEIFFVEVCSSFYEEVDDLFVACEGGLVERG